MSIIGLREISFLSLLLTGACVSGPKPLYQWGDYQPALLSYAKNPQETQKFADRIKVDIAKAEIKDAVPPGLYAEYGYALLELNNPSGAVEFFGKERAKWPESSFLMTRLIDRLSRSRAETTTSSTGGNSGGGAPLPPPLPLPSISVKLPTNG